MFQQVGGLGVTVMLNSNQPMVKVFCACFHCSMIADKHTYNTNIHKEPNSTQLISKRTMTFYEKLPYCAVIIASDTYWNLNSASFCTSALLLDSIRRTVCVFNLLLFIRNTLRCLCPVNQYFFEYHIQYAFPLIPFVHSSVYSRCDNSNHIKANVLVWENHEYELFAIQVITHVVCGAVCLWK